MARVRVRVQVRVQVRYFATLREQLGDGGAHRVRAGTTVGALWEGVLAERPGLRRLRVRFAVNEHYVEVDRVLQDGDEVAVFPPVSGGC
jgi:molybdopterin synthase sulfur carrier subunit